MSDGDLRDRVGEDVSEAELERLQRADELLRATPAPPEVPASLTAAVLAIPQRFKPFARRRLLVAACASAALAAGTFAIGFWVGRPASRAVAERVTLVATPAAPPSAKMVLTVLPVDTAGNWQMVGTVSGLRPLPKHAYYEVWMTRSGKPIAACGRFVVDDGGRATGIWLNAPYDLHEYDRWVVAEFRGGHRSSAWLLDGPVEPL
jgi:hypothetical protein